MPPAGPSRFSRLVSQFACASHVITVRTSTRPNVAWAPRFILFHGKRHPSSMRTDEVNAYLTTLATRDQVSAATQNQALCAILFLDRYVLGDSLPWIDGIVRAQRP